MGSGGDSSAAAKPQMQPHSDPAQTSILRMGDTARLCLLPGREGRVLAAFSKAVYLLADEDLCWITTSEAPMHRRSAVVAGALPQVCAGAPFRVESNHLVIYPTSSLNITGAAQWRAPQPKHRIGLDELHSCIDGFFSALDLSRARGFGLFIPGILGIWRGEPAAQLPESAGPILLAAQPLVLNLARACLERHASQVVRCADALVGLGEGLTPSGDDLLGGIFFALCALRSACPGFDFIQPQLLTADYASRTNQISHALLNDLANGHAIAPLHSLVNGLLGGAAPSELAAYINELTRTGHSTGWDLLAGLLTGLLSVSRNGHSVNQLPICQAVQG